MNQQPIGVTNFFKLISSLDSEKINPFGDAAIQKNIASIEFPGLFEELSPRFERLGVDVSTFKEKVFAGAEELPKAWSKFITSEAEKVLTWDFVNMIGIASDTIKKRCITSTQVNTIIGFTIMYFDVIENKKINKKDVIEGVLMKGIIKKSSFYQKIADADQRQQGNLSWDPKAEYCDDIWQHFILQTCRFLKQTVHNLNHFIHDGVNLKTQLQEMIDQGEYEQFNSRGRRGNKQYYFMLLLMLGFACLSGVGILNNQPEPNEPASQVADNTAVEAEVAENELPVFEGLPKFHQEHVLASANLEPAFQNVLHGIDSQPLLTRPVFEHSSIETSVLPSQRTLINFQQ